MRDGFVRVAVGTPEIHVADCEFNAKSAIALMKDAQSRGVKLLTLPEMCLTGYTAQDLLSQDTLIKGTLDALTAICHASEGMQMITVIGLPICERGTMYNCAAVVQDGRIMGVVPKRNLPNYGGYFEKRYFSSGTADVRLLKLGDTEIPFGGNLLFECNEMPEFRFAVEIGEDLCAIDAPSVHHAVAGATVIVNPAAKEELVGQAEFLKQQVIAHSTRLICAYLYANAGMGESTQDAVFSGHSLIVEKGELLNESVQYTTGLTISEIDLGRIEAERRRMNLFHSTEKYLSCNFHMDVIETELSRRIDPMPFVPEDSLKRSQRCEEILNIQAHGLMQRLRHTHTRTAVIGVSGGLDSTLALLVTERAFRLLGLPSAGILAITMPCFGTTQRTRTNAEILVEQLGMSFREIRIAEAVTQHFIDIGQEMENHDVTFENSQARERTQVLMDIANQNGGIVIGTGDLSELALGWATYNGDHMSMYSVNSSVPKTLVRYLVRHVAEHTTDEALKNVLCDILDTPVSPELLPPVDGDIAQKTEDLVGPYELHDFFLYHFMRRGSSPSKILRMAKRAFAGRYDETVIAKWLNVFFRRFFSQQFKRSCLPDGPKVGTVAVSPRGDLHMPSDASSGLWQKL